MSERVNTKALRALYNAVKRDALARTDDAWRVNDDPDGFVRVHQGYALTCRLIADTMSTTVATFVSELHNAAPAMLDELDALRAENERLREEIR